MRTPRDSRASPAASTRFLRCFPPAGGTRCCRLYELSLDGGSLVGQIAGWQLKLLIKQSRISPTAEPRGKGRNDSPRRRSPSPSLIFRNIASSHARQVERFFEYRPAISRRCNLNVLIERDENTCCEMP